jgi:hypothetical protein
MRYEVEVKDVDVEWASGRITTAKLLIWEEDPSDAKLVKLSLRFDGREITSSDEDYFSAMCSIRRVLEKEGGLLRCYGASLNVYPSPMSRDMGGGVKAYKLRMGAHAKIADLVSIFETGPDVSSASVDEQERFYIEWLQSIGVIKSHRYSSSNPQR